MSAKPHAMALMRRSPKGRALPLRLFHWNSMQSYHPDSPIFRVGEPHKAPRPYKGLDMDKIINSKPIDIWQTYFRSSSGYCWSPNQGNNPSVKAMTLEELSEFYTCEKYWEKHSLKEIIHAMRGPLYFGLNFQSCFLQVFLLFTIPALFLNAFEPLEIHMPADDYFENFEWNENGFHHDQDAYRNYLEARRTKKWRQPDLDVVEYIPPQYRSQAQKEARGEA